MQTILLQLESVRKNLIKTLLIQFLSLHCTQTMVVKMMQNQLMFVYVYIPYVGTQKVLLLF